MQKTIIFILVLKKYFTGPCPPPFDPLPLSSSCSIWLPCPHLVHCLAPLPYLAPPHLGPVWFPATLSGSSALNCSPCLPFWPPASHLARIWPFPCLTPSDPLSGWGWGTPLVGLFISMFISISTHKGSISPQMFPSAQNNTFQIPKIVMKQPYFHQKGT